MGMACGEMVRDDSDRGLDVINAASRRRRIALRTLTYEAGLVASVVGGDSAGKTSQEDLCLHRTAQ